MSLIGVFDSGVGGLTVLREMRRRLPGCDFLYQAGNYLWRRNIDLLVVACNTASAFALPELSSRSPVPVLGVVEPGVRAAIRCGARRIGVIGTEGTIRSAAYQNALHRLRVDLSIRARACPLFVPLAEEGWGDHEITRQVARIYLQEILDWGAEALILGCTHYPLLQKSIARVAGPAVKLVDSASSLTDAVIEDHAAILGRGKGQGRLFLHLTDASEPFLRIADSILNSRADEFRVVDLGDDPE